MRLSYRLLIAAVLLHAGATWTPAAPIEFRDYMHLRHGMTEAQVLMRVGPPDYERELYGYYGGIFGRIWYYLPEEYPTREYITEIHFDALGHIRRLERYRP
jgi:hypothetical protein